MNSKLNFYIQTVNTILTAQTNKKNELCSVNCVACESKHFKLKKKFESNTTVIQVFGEAAVGDAPSFIIHPVYILKNALRINKILKHPGFTK